MQAHSERLALTSQLPKAPLGSQGSRRAANAACSIRRRREPLQVAACHRCLTGQLVAARPTLLQAVGRGPCSAAALKGTEPDARPLIDLQARDVDSSTQSQQAVKQEEQQAAATQPAAAQQQGEQESAGVKAALAMLRFYKSAISPLLPPACRYLPTCSVYSMEAFQRFGVGKGFVLTAWRLLRCSPFGSSGYDPVRWPPPGLEFVFGSADRSSDGGSGSGSSGGSKRQ